jgi:hypothetical protein
LLRSGVLKFQILFYFTSKNNFPIYFSVFCLIFVAVLLYTIYTYHRQNGLRDSRYWLVLTIGFLYLSIDESVNIHGSLTNLIRALFHTDGALFYAWVIPAIIICLILAIYFLPFFLRLPYRYKVLFGLSTLLFVGGTVVLKVVTSYFDPQTGQFRWLMAILGTIKQIRFNGKHLYDD